ncbi:MAG TPA: Tol-Pal system protein TolB, partial [Alphaproteobacteria bacterium]|nr:Tol-Pal system protein TolB [Alphaproteobacteria bacterium]
MICETGSEPRKAAYDRRGGPLRTTLWLLALTFAIVVPLVSAQADLRVDITRGQVEPMPVAISDLYGESDDAAKFGRRISEVVARNLERSGLFRPIDQRAFIQRPEAMLSGPRFADWRQINAQALVTGRVRVMAGDKLEVEFRLWDIFAEQHLVGLRLGSASSQWRRIAHKVTDAIYERLTGEVGYFDTRIVYIAETGPLDARIKRLAIMDQDGENLRFLSDGKQLVLTPRFSPTAQEITYLSYENGIPRVVLRRIDSGQQEVLGNFPGMTFAPRFSPDGNSVVLTYAADGNSDLFEMDLRSHKVRRLTDNGAIDTAPSYSPDGQQIVFESDRSGEQQIYVMDRQGSKARR